MHQARKYILVVGCGYEPQSKMNNN